MGFLRAPIDRRRVLAGGVVGGAAATLAPAGLTGAPAEAAGRRALRAAPGGVRALDLPITGTSMTARQATSWRTEKMSTSEFRMVGATWREGRPDLRVRTREGGRWTDWRPLRHLHDEPDRDSDEGRRRARRAVDLLWVGRADGVQLEVAGDGAPDDLVLTLIHPGRRDADALEVPRAKPERPGRKRGGRRGERPAIPMPAMFTREDWGADPRLRDGRPVYLQSIRQVHVHHTVSSNSYDKGDVPGMIRGMYRYHTVNLGWSDIGYNFLVDRFGRIWVGRAGGPKRAVQGAHTLGFNNSSTGVSVIGNFETARPPKAVLRGIARLASWKLDLYDRKPRAKIRVTSTGSDRFRAGQTVRLPVIDGHRDTNETACPGINLYRDLPAVRQLTFRRMRRIRRGGNDGGGIPDRRAPGRG